MVQFANSEKITVEFKELGGEVQGVSRGGSIVLTPGAGTKTLIHEIAHELMHREVDRSVLSPKVRELEAESVAYVVARHFGLKDLNSPNYVALHGADAGMILAHLERIRNIATKIIKSLDEKIEGVFS